jgi:hypothetical protein
LWFGGWGTVRELSVKLTVNCQGILAGKLTVNWQGTVRELSGKLTVNWLFPTLPPSWDRGITLDLR